MLLGTVLLVLLLHLVAGEGAATYSKDSKQTRSPVSFSPSLLLKLVRVNVEARNPKDTKQLLFPPQDMDHLLFPPQNTDQILSPSQDRKQLFYSPLLKGKSSGLWGKLIQVKLTFSAQQVDIIGNALL